MNSVVPVINCKHVVARLRFNLTLSWLCAAVRRIQVTASINSCSLFQVLFYAYLVTQIYFVYYRHGKVTRLLSTVESSWEPLIQLTLLWEQYVVTSV